MTWPFAVNVRNFTASTLLSGVRAPLTGSHATACACASRAEGRGTQLHTRLVYPRTSRAHSSHNRFCHEDIWLADPIGIWHDAHNHIALLLVKLVGMPGEI